MKTTEEKAKAYDEAKEKMREIITMDDKNKPVMPREIAEYLFPELKESEDERIRNDIKKIVSDWWKKLGDVAPGFSTEDETLSWLEKQKEQKPAECLKAERDGWYVCIKDYYSGGKKQCTVGDLVQAKGGMYIMGEEDISEWFRKAYYEEVRNAFEPNTDTNIPEKPVEWSEEDRDRAAQYLHDLDGGMLWSKATEITSDILDILRPLCPKPNWKPTQEQIKAFQDALDRDGGYNKWALYALYNDLQKLAEE